MHDVRCLGRMLARVAPATHASGPTNVIPVAVVTGSRRLAMENTSKSAAPKTSYGPAKSMTSPPSKTRIATFLGSGTGFCAEMSFIPHFGHTPGLS